MEKNNSEKKPNWLVKAWRWICKFFRDTVGELKKVVWTPKNELVKSTKLVVITVAVICIAIALIDLGSSWLINTVAGLIG